MNNKNGSVSTLRGIKIKARKIITQLRFIDIFLAIGLGYILGSVIDIAVMSVR